jgi:hypothetical protein
VHASINSAKYFRGAFAAASPSRQLDLDPEPTVPVVLPEDRFFAVTHEFGHAFGLEDEYGDEDGTIDAALSLGYNLVKKTQVKPGNFDGDQIKWRWLRYEAAVLIKTIAPNPNNAINNGDGLVLTFNTNDLIGFAETDKVRLRQPTIGDVDPNDQVPLAQYSVELTIVKIDIDNNEIYVDGLNSNPGFPADSRLVKLILAEAPGIGTISTNGVTVNGAGTWFKTQVGNNIGNNTGNGATIKVNGVERLVQSVGDDLTITLQQAFPANIPANSAYSIIPKERYAELLNNSVRLSITKNNKAMTSDPYNNIESASEMQLPEFAQLTFDGSANTQMSIYTEVSADPHAIVGLYAGGYELEDGGVYHPTGYCVMRRSADAKSLFCPVCQYAMVDQVDPSKHYHINLIYNKLNNPKI